MQGGGGVSEQLLTTKGDTHGFSNQNSRVGIGLDTQVLTADSAQALGLKWATPTDIAPPTSVKGDLSGFSTTQARIPISTNGTVLTADSAQALGLKWATPATPASEFPIVLGNTSVNAGSTNATLNALTLSDAGDLKLNIASKLILKDGTGTDNKIYTKGGSAVGNNSITFEAGGTQLMQLNGSNNYLWLKDDTRLSLGGNQGLTTEASIMYKTADDSLEFRSPNDVQRMNLTTTGVDILGVLKVNGVVVESTPLWKIIAFG